MSNPDRNGLPAHSSTYNSRLGRLTLNNRVFPTSERAVRVALNQALDRAALEKLTYATLGALLRARTGKATPELLAGLLEAIVDRLAAESEKILARSEVRERFAVLGIQVDPMKPAALGKFQQSELEKWARLAKAANIIPE